MIHLIENLSPASAGSTLWPLLVECATKGTALLAVAALAALFFHRASAARRHLVWALALGGLAVLPLMLAALPEWKVRSRAVEWIAPEIPAERLAFDVTTEAATQAPQGVAASREVGSTPSPSVETRTITPPATGATSTPATPSRPIDWRAIAAGVWLLGALLVLATFATGHLVLRSLLRDARVVRDGEWHELALEAADRLRLTLPFALLRGRGIPVPVAFGIVRPRVLLPPEADTWPVERRRSVLLHELAHVQRRDCATQAIAQLACAIFWFHPAVWWASSRLRVERERACDDRVLASATRPSDYADHLLDVVRSLRATRLAALGAVAFAKKSSLEGRLLAVLDSRRDRRTVSVRVLLPAAALAALVVLPLAALEPARVQAGMVHGREDAQDAKDNGLGEFGIRSLPPSSVQKRTVADGSLDDAVTWARKEAARTGADVWWVGWRLSAGARESGGFLSDTQGFDLDMLGKQGLLSLDDVLEGRARGTSQEIRKGIHPAGLLLRMDHGVLDRVRIQSLDMPAEFGKNQPLYWFENVAPEPAFAWLRSETSRAKEEDVRARLVESVGYLDRSDLTESFLRATLEGGDSQQVRKHAAKALGLDPSPASLRLLHQHARTDRSSDVRRECVEALGRHRTPAALDALIDLAGADSDGDVRRAAFDQMGEKVAEQRGDEASVRAEADAVREANRVQVDADLRSRKAERREESDVWQEASQAIDPAELDVQRQAIESLGRYPEAQSLPRLKRLAETAPHQDLRMQAVESIGRLQTKASNAVLEEVLWKNHMEGARNAAVEAIAKNLPENDALDELERVVLTHPSVNTRRMAVEQIGRFPSARSRQILLKTVSTSNDLDCRMTAVESLGRRDDADVVEQLMQIVRTNPSDDVRRTAVEAIGRRKDDGDNVERLASLARGEGSVEVRRQAVESLGRLSDPRVKSLLLDLARKGGTVDVERQAVESFARLDGDDVMPALAGLARNHPRGDVRRQAVESMTRRDPDRALPLIEEILKQPTKPRGTL